MQHTTRLALIIAVALLIHLLPFAIIGELPGERRLSATDDNALLFGITGASLLAVDVLLPIPSSTVGTLHNDWAANDHSCTFALLETEDAQLLEQIQAPFRGYLAIEVTR